MVVAVGGSGIAAPLLALSMLIAAVWAPCGAASGEAATRHARAHAPPAAWLAPQTSVRRLRLASARNRCPLVRRRAEPDGESARGLAAGGDAGAPRAPVVVHVGTKEALNAVIAAQPGLSFADANEIISLGAALQRKSEHEPWTRLKAHTVLEEDSWLKFFPQPQRFPACAVDWSRRLLHQCDKYVIIDKPCGLPCQVPRQLATGAVSASSYLCIQARTHARIHTHTHTNTLITSHTRRTSRITLATINAPTAHVAHRRWRATPWRQPPTALQGSNTPTP